MPRIEIELERVERAEDLVEVSDERFDRMAFAERAVALIRPPHTTVAICEGTSRVRVTSGRQWGGQDGARWAVLHVPRDASRQAIARAVLGLGDFRSALRAPDVACATPYRGTSRAWRLDVLVSLLGRSGEAPPYVEEDQDEEPAPASCGMPKTKT